MKRSKIIKNFFRDPVKYCRKAYKVFKRRDYHKRLNMTLRQWLVYHQGNIHFKKSQWMGVKTLKNPCDCWIYQEIIFKVKPDIIIEIGSAEGGSTLYLANLLDIIGNGTVVSIDINRDSYRVKHNRIIEITGDSSSPDVVKKVTELCANKCALVIHDGDHRKEQVLKDLKNYSQLVAQNSYLIVEDGIADLFTPGYGFDVFEDGPLAAVEDFLRTNSNFVVDNECERYILTYNPKGFLKRIK